MTKRELPKRVSIKYTCDLIEVPDRVRILIDELSLTLTVIATRAKTVSKMCAEDPGASLAELKKVSNLLEKSKERVDDSLEILIGYARILMDNDLSAPQTPTPTDIEEIENPKTKKTKKKKPKKEKSNDA